MTNERRDRAIGAPIDIDGRAFHHGVETLTRDSRRVHPHPGRKRADLGARPGHVVKFTERETRAHGCYVYSVRSALVRERFGKLDRKRFGRGVKRVSCWRGHEPCQ